MLILHYQVLVCGLVRSGSAAAVPGPLPGTQWGYVKVPHEGV